MWPFKKKTVVSIVPETQTEKLRVFRVSEDFTALINGIPQKYKRGQAYTIRPGNDELAAVAERAVESGVASMTDEVSRVSGAGVVI